MQSRFEGNNIGLFGGVIYNEFGSDITIVNTTFVNNRVYIFRSDCNASSGVIYADSPQSTVKIYDSKFVQNVGVVFFGDNCNMIVTNTKFINNENSGFFATLAVIMYLIVTSSSVTVHSSTTLDVS